VRGLQTRRIADELEWVRGRQRQSELREQFLGQPDTPLVSALVRREDRDRPDWKGLPSGGDGLRLDRVEPVRLELATGGVTVPEVVAREEPLNVELQGLFVGMEPEYGCRVDARADRVETRKLSERGSVIASDYGVRCSAEPGIDLLDVRYDRRDEDELRRPDIARTHTRQQELKADAAATTVEQMPLIADHEGNSLKELRIGAEKARERLRGGYERSNVFEIVHLFPGGHGSAVEGSGIQTHPVEPLHERCAELGREGAVWYQDDRDVGWPVLKMTTVSVSAVLPAPVGIWSEKVESFSSIPPRIASI
jgi:hypothetical protein